MAKEKSYLKITEKGYIYDRRLFQESMVIIILCLLVIAYQEKFNFGPHYYFKCDAVFGDCENPYHTALVKYTGFNKLERAKCDWCDKETLPPGEYGEKDPGYAKAFVIIVFSMVLLSFCMNHFLYNKGKKLDIDFPFKSKIKKYAKGLEDDEKL